MTMKAVLFLLAAILSVSHGWSFQRPVGLIRQSSVSSRNVALHLAASAAAGSAPEPVTKALTPAEKKKQERKELVRQEGGLFAFDTKYGALNPYAIYYGLTSITLGLVWFVALTACQLLYKVTGNRVDKLRRLPVFFSQMWGETLMFLVRAKPKIEGRDKLKEFFKKNEAAMFVANHNSWLDILFIGHTIGWRNYKMVAKAELKKVPILGKAIACGGNIMLDRSNRRSQVQTLKAGIQMLKDGVHLCTFPEGTRSRSGRIGKFKNGAFKMAHKNGAPIVPLSIVGASKAMPPHWMFPYRFPRGVAKVVVHDPIPSVGKTEEELAEEVRKAVIDGLPEDQRPLNQ